MDSGWLLLQVSAEGQQQSIEKAASEAKEKKSGRFILRLDFLKQPVLRGDYALDSKPNGRNG